MLRGILLALCLPVAWPALGRAPPVALPAPPPTCLTAIAAAERQQHLPPQLLGSIALVESGRPDPTSGRSVPWPWTINVGGAGVFFASKVEAMAAVAALQQAGLRSIDVGCLQVNLYFHPHAFASLAEAFDPLANAAYGGHFLAALHAQFGNWPQAAAAYHSQTPALGQVYETRVMALWPLAARFPDPRRAPAADYSRYTPDFAARVKQMDEDRARLEARFGAAVAPGRS